MGGDHRPAIGWIVSTGGVFCPSVVSLVRLRRQGPCGRCWQGLSRVSEGDLRCELLG